MAFISRSFRIGFLATAFAAAPPMTAQQSSVSNSPSLPPEAYTAGRYSRSDEIKLTGKIRRAENVDGKFYLWVHANAVEQQGLGTRPGMEVPGKGMLWRIDGIDPVSYDINKFVDGVSVKIAGLNSTDNSCKPTCRMSSRKLSFD